MFCFFVIEFCCFPKYDDSKDFFANFLKFDLFDNVDLFK